MRAPAPAFLALIVLAQAPAALARPGLYLGLGLGSASVKGSDVPLSRMQGVTFSPGYPDPLSTDIDGGLLGVVKLGFNILGYAAPELTVTGFGRDLGNNNREFAAHWHAGVRAYPLWHWRNALPEALRPLEPSVLVAFGQSFQGYNVLRDSTGDVGWERLGTWRYGLGVEYFLLDFLKAGLDYNFIKASYDTFIFSASGPDAEVKPPASTTYHELHVTLALHLSFGS